LIALLMLRFKVFTKHQSSNSSLLRAKVVSARVALLPLRLARQWWVARAANGSGL
jgi:hypothetical protein